MSNIFKWLAMLMLATIIAACGGGSGGGGDGSPAVPPAPGSSPVTIDFPTDQGFNVLMPGESVSFTVVYPLQAAAAGKALTATSSVPVALSLSGAASGTYSFNESNFDLTSGGTPKTVILTIDPAAVPAQFNNPQLVADVAGYQTSTPIDLQIVSATEASITFNSNGLELSTESSAVVNLVASGFTGGDAGARVVTLRASNEGITVSPATCTVSQNAPVCPVTVSSTTTAGNFQITATTPGGVLQVLPLNVSVLARNSIGFNPDSVTLMTKGSGGLDTTTVTLYANQLDKATSVTIDNTQASLTIQPSYCNFAIGDGSCQVTITSLGDVSGDYTITAITPDGYTVPSLAVHIDTPGSLAFYPAGLKMFTGESYPATMKYTATTATSGSIPVTFTATPGVSVNTGESNPLICTLDVQNAECTVVITANNTGANIVAATEPAGTTITPLAVEVNGFKSLTAGYQFRCGLNASGQAYCWGNGTNGKMGNGTSLRDNSTFQAVTQSGVAYKSLTAGSYFICGLTASGKAYCWGGGRYGPIGNGASAIDNITPQAVSGDIVFASLAASTDTVCGLTASGQTYCWGNGEFGQIGNGTSVSTNATPQAVTQNGVNYTSIVVGKDVVCGLSATGQAYCWGHGTNGEIGNGASVNVSTPQAVLQNGVTYASLTLNIINGTTVTGVMICGLSSTGQAYCWGFNSNNQSNSNIPLAVSQNGIMYSSIIRFGYTSCGLTAAGQAYCWGEGKFGQIGNGSFNYAATPQAVTQGGVMFSSISAYDDTACGLSTSGQAYCWGFGAFGEIGNGASVNVSTPQAVLQNGTEYASLNAGPNTICGVRATGQAYCWGNGDYGQIGNGKLVNVNVPTAVITPPVEEVNSLSRLLNTYGAK